MKLSNINGKHLCLSEVRCMPLNLYVLVPIMVIFKIMCYFHLATPIRQLIIISLHSKVVKCNVCNNLPTSVIDYNFKITWRLNGRVSYIQCVSQIAVTNVILLTNKKLHNALDDACIYVNQFYLNWYCNFVFWFFFCSFETLQVMIWWILSFINDRQTDR